ncbi:TolC family protein [Candidatus Neomarinimicrobiota bacterium]
MQNYQTTGVPRGPENDRKKTITITTWHMLAILAVSTTMVVGQEVGTTGLSIPLEQMLQANREVRAAEQVYQAAQARIGTIGLPDPMLENTSFLQAVETRNGPMENQIMLGQKFPLWGKLKRQKLIAGQKAEIARTMLDQKRVQVAFQMRSAWENIVTLERSLAILINYRDELESFKTIALTQYSTGSGLTQHPVLKLQIEISLTESRINELQGDLAAAVHTLQQLFDGSYTPDLFAGQRTTVPTEQLDDYWLDIARENNPRYRKARAEVEVASLDHQLAKRKSYPDLTTGLTYTAIGTSDNAIAPESGADALGVKLGLNIPIWFGKNKSASRATKLTQNARQDQLLAVWNQIEDNVRSVVDALAEIEETYDLYSSRLISESEQMLASAYSAYETGKISFLDVLDSQRMVVRVRLEFESVEQKRRIASAKLLMNVGLIDLEEVANNEG